MSLKRTQIKTNNNNKVMNVRIELVRRRGRKEKWKGDSKKNDKNQNEMNSRRKIIHTEVEISMKL